ncbi:MAG: phosphate signaling complex protein PhoU [Oscillospiraceae bacterium]|nr:phosphate signaling complex protein PhoU [Oscillospiraceae bacterium]
MMNYRQAFNTELSDLSNSLIRMGATAADAIDRAIAALNTGDKDLARQVIEDDNQIDDLARDIEQRCLRLLLKQQPVAGDLRRISTAIKMITDIERIGDSAADIAEISLQLNAPAPPEVAADVETMAAAARSMVGGAIDAYVKEDLELARATREKDDIVDSLFLKIRAELGQRMAADATAWDEIMDYLMIIKYLERIGDHAENICEWVEFYKTGVHKNVRII